MISSHSLFRCSIAAFALALFTSAASAAQAPKKEETADPNAPISYYKQIRPIFQGQCNGCHQPAKSKGDYIMTDFAKLLKGGENGDAILIAELGGDEIGSTDRQTADDGLELFVADQPG